MEMIFTIACCLFLGFLASRIAVMLYDFLSYGEIFGHIKMNIAFMVDPERVMAFFEDIKDMPKSEAQTMSLEMYDIIAAKSFTISLMDCKFCLSIWVSLIVAAIAVMGYDVGIEAFVFVPVFAYLITEKI